MRVCPQAHAHIGTHWAMPYRSLGQSKDHGRVLHRWAAASKSQYNMLDLICMTLTSIVIGQEKTLTDGNPSLGQIRELIAQGLSPARPRDNDDISPG